MDIKVGDVYVRHSDKKSYRVKSIDNIMVVLEAVDGSGLSLADIFGIKKAYSRTDPKPAPESP